MDEIMAAVAMLQRGEREDARGRLLHLWSRLGHDSTPLQRCTLAHFLADTEDDVGA